MNIATTGIVIKVSDPERDYGHQFTYVDSTFRIIEVKNILLFFSFFSFVFSQSMGLSISAKIIEFYIIVLCLLFLDMLQYPEIQQ